jgi:hypothetical protein
MQISEAYQGAMLEAYTVFAAPSRRKQLYQPCGPVFLKPLPVLCCGEKRSIVVGGIRQLGGGGGSINAGCIISTNKTLKRLKRLPSYNRTRFPGGVRSEEREERVVAAACTTARTALKSVACTPATVQYCSSSSSSSSRNSSSIEACCMHTSQDSRM